MLMIRLARIGKKKRPFYRVVVTEKTRPRNGRFVEIVGTYDPLKKPAAIIASTTPGSSIGSAKAPSPATRSAASYVTENLSDTSYSPQHSCIVRISLFMQIPCGFFAAGRGGRSMKQLVEIDSESAGRSSRSKCWSTPWKASRSRCWSCGFMPDDSGKSHWASGSHREIHSHLARCRRNEAEESALRWKFWSKSPGKNAHMAESVTVALIVRPHGVRGEVAAEILTDFPERLKHLPRVTLSDWHRRASHVRSVSRSSCWLSHSRGGQAIFHFDGVIPWTTRRSWLDSKCTFRSPSDARFPMAAITLGSGRLRSGGNQRRNSRRRSRRGNQRAGRNDCWYADSAAVDSRHGELLIPLAQEICVRVDLAARRIEVMLPEGLRELNTANSITASGWPYTDMRCDSTSSRFSRSFSPARSITASCAARAKRI